MSHSAAAAGGTVAVIGGGFTGAAVAHQLARRAPGAFRIVVIEPRAELGAGVAYSTTDPAHRINVPAARMSVVPSDPRHFSRWLEADGALTADPEALTPDGRAFPRRAVFGRYVAETIDPDLLSGAIEHRRARAAGVSWRDGRYAVTLSDDDVVDADFLVLAASHPSPTAPRAFATLSGDPRLIADTQDRAALAAVPRDARVLIVGSGLTMADIVASLEARGHQGPVVAVSRRGLLSRGHAATAGEFGAFTENPSVTALAILRRIRLTVAAASAEGRPWQHVLDAARTQARAIWAALPVGERRQVVRRLRPFWDVHRFRVAPQVEAAVNRMRASGQLTLVRAEPIGSVAADDGIAVRLRTPAGETERTFDAVALATGPAHRTIVETDPLIASLAGAGLLTPDLLGLGLAVDQLSRAIGPDGRASEGFYVAGPLARAAFGELMGLPEVARHAEEVAVAVLTAARAAAAPRRAVA